MRIAASTRTPRLALKGLAPGDAIHGLTDGSWSFSDALQELLRLAGPSDVVVSTWTAYSGDITRAESALSNKRIKTFRLLVDRSFPTRKPKYCALARKLFGDDAIRIWNSHAKFCIVKGDRLSALYLTSANLNANKRIENFSAIADDRIVGKYEALVDSLFAIQRPSEGFARPAVARHHTEDAMNDLFARKKG